MVEGGRGSIINFSSAAVLQAVTRAIGYSAAKATPTERGKLVIHKTPFDRFGKADELHGAIHYLLADASQFVTGTVLRVVGGFSAFSGV